MSHDLRNSKSTGSNVGDTGYVNDSWLDEQDDIEDSNKDALLREESTDHKALEGERAPVPMLSIHYYYVLRVATSEWSTI